MKIAYDAKRFFQNSSGLGNYSRDLIRILSGHYPENKYLLLNTKKTKKGKEILEKQNVFFHSIPDSKLSRQLKMGKEAQDSGADIFHGLSGELPLKWNKKPIKKIVTVHDLIFLRFPQFYSFFDKEIHLWKFKKAAKKSDRIIAISEQTKKDIVHYLKVPENKIEVIYQGCHEAFKNEIPEQTLSMISEKYSLPHRFILNVGTIEERKNLHRVVQALKGTGIPLVVVGKKTKYFKKVKKAAEKGKVETYFLEKVSMEDLAVIYRLADIFIYPSLFEGFGIPVIEALYSSTPVITSNRSSLPEAGGEDSVYVDPENIEDINSKILFLWNNEAERKRRAEKGLKYVQKFNDDQIAQQINSLYQKILKK